MPSNTRTLVRRKKQIAERIAGLLEAKGWTQKELAERAGMKESYVSKVLHADANLTLGTIALFEATLEEQLIKVLTSDD